MVGTDGEAAGPQRYWMELRRKRSHVHLARVRIVSDKRFAANTGCKAVLGPRHQTSEVDRVVPGQASAGADLARKS